MGQHSLATSPATRSRRRMAGIVVAVVATGVWTAAHTPTPPPPTVTVAPATTESPLRLAELYHPAKDTSSDVDTPAATAFLASLRQSGVALADDREDTAIDLARQVAASHAAAADLRGAVRTLFPELTPDQAALFVTGAGTYFGQR